MAFAGAQAAALAVAGGLADAGSLYFVGAAVGSTHSLHLAASTDLDDAAACGRSFRSAPLGGAVVLLGAALDGWVAI